MNGCGLTLAVSTSEAAPSFLRPLIWRRNSQVCYAYPHDFDGSSFPIKKDNVKYPKSNGWPEWFSRGWTLQEVIAPQDLQFFNNYLQPIGNKKTLAQTLQLITQVPEHILADGLEGDRPCCSDNIVGCQSDDDTSGRQSVLIDEPVGCEHADAVWREEEGISPSSAGDHPLIQQPKHLGDNSDVRIGGMLADHPSFFEGCSKMEPIGHGSSSKNFQKVGKVSRSVIVAISPRLCDGRGMNIVGGSVWRVEARSQGCQAL